MSGPGCTASIAGVDVSTVNSKDSNTAIHVNKDQTIHVQLGTDAGSPQTIHVDYGLVAGITIGKDGSGSSTDVNVGAYASLTGLYLVQARTGPDGTCSAAALVDVGGSALGTVAGDAAAGAMGVGAASLIAAGAIAALGSSPVPSGSEADPGSASPSEMERPADSTLPDDQWRRQERARNLPTPVYNERTKEMELDTMTETGAIKRVPLCGATLPMALMMTTLAMMGALPSAPAGGAPPRRMRVGWRPRLSVLGIGGALLGSAGAVVFLELNGNVYPTRTYTIIALAVGLAIGLVVPSLGNAVRVWRLNRRLRKRELAWEQRAASARLAKSMPPPTTPPAPPAS